MAPIWFFASGRLLYGLLERRDRGFATGEVIAQLAFVGLTTIMLRIESVVLRALVFGAVFFLSGVVVRRLYPRHPIEAEPVGPGDREWEVAVGIIDVGWLSIMAAALAFVMFAQGSPPFRDPMPSKGLSPAYYESLAENLRFLLGRILDAFLALGATLGVCMAVLWAGEIWRKRSPDARRRYIGATIASRKMVLAFFVASFGALIWMGVPLYQKLVAIPTLNVP